MRYGELCTDMRGTAFSALNRLLTSFHQIQFANCKVGTEKVPNPTRLLTRHHRNIRLVTVGVTVTTVW